MTSQPSVRIKSYFAPTVVAAITQAREELGDDALLLNTRKIAGNAGQPASYEVVFGLSEPEGADSGRGTAASNKESGVRSQESEGRNGFAGRPDLRTPLRGAGQLRDERAVGNLELEAVSLITRALGMPAEDNRAEDKRVENKRVENKRAENKRAENKRAEDEPAEIRLRVAPREAAAPEPKTEPKSGSKKRGGDVAGEIEKLHAQIDEIRSLMARPRTAQMTAARSTPELNEIYKCLVASGVDAAIAKDIVDRVEAGKAPRTDAARLQALVLSELEQRVSLKPRLGAIGEHGAVVAMVGPTGAGKTTSIMKLAASELAAGRRVRVLSLDPSGSGQNHLQRFAGNLGGTYTAVQSVHALPAMVAQSGADDLIFIDTPGYPASGDPAIELAAAAIGKIRPADVHLVAPGYMKSADLARSIRKYDVFRPSRLLATKLDETDTFGSIFSEASRAGLALSFIANGTAIPQDIRPAAAEDLLSLAFERKLAQAQCA